VAVGYPGEEETTVNGDGNTSNLAAGQEDGDRGRALGGQALAAKPAPEDCAHCTTMGYTSWMQHIGHLGWRGMMVASPETAKKLRKRIAETGRPESRARWREISR